MKNRLSLAAAILLSGLALSVVAVQWLALAHGRAVALGDIDIYRGALLSQAAGTGLYDYLYVRPDTVPRGFTYPPFAALVLQPTTWVGREVLDGAWIVLTVLVLTWSIGFVVRRTRTEGDSWLGASPSPAQLVAATAGLATLALLTFPFIHHFVVGQVSIFVMALCLVDVAGVLPPRWRGVLVGIAAAIKLTPLVFAGYFLLTRQGRAAVLTVGSFCAATALAWVIFPAESVTYWTRKVFETSRVGDLDSVINKSLLGTISRLGLTGTPALLVWAALGLAVSALVLLRARRIGLPPLMAALEVGCLSTLVSPISWPHHQLWVVLAGLWLLLQRNRITLWWGIAVLAPLLVYQTYLDVDSPGLGQRVAWELPVAAALVVCLVGLSPRARTAPATTR